MKLTQKQEFLVARFLRATADALGDVSEGTRERALRRTKALIYKGLSQRESPTGGLEDEDVAAVLDSLGVPGRTAENPVETAPSAAPEPGERTPLSPAPPPPHETSPVPTHAPFDRRPLPLGSASRTNGPRLAPEEAIWLGVCAGVARFYGFQPWLVRGAAFLLGLITGPVALLVYLGLYVALRVVSRGSDATRIRIWPLVKYPALTLVVPIAFHEGTKTALKAILEAYNRWSGLAPLYGVGTWDWLQGRMGGMLFLVLFACLPLSVLSALPVARHWDYTFKRLIQACVAVYVMALSFGIASFLVGIVLHVVEELTGKGVNPLSF